MDNLPTGFPIIKGKQRVGGIGSGGATAYGDASVARVALFTGGFSAEDADTILKELMKARNILAKGQLI